MLVKQNARGGGPARSKIQSVVKFTATSRRAWRQAGVRAPNRDREFPDCDRNRSADPRSALPLRPIRNVTVSPVVKRRVTSLMTRTRRVASPAEDQSSGDGGVVPKHKVPGDIAPRVALLADSPARVHCSCSGPEGTETTSELRRASEPKRRRRRPARRASGSNVEERPFRAAKAVLEEIGALAPGNSRAKLKFGRW